MADLLTITVNGVSVSVPAGTVLAAALFRAGVVRFRRSTRGEPRGPLCGMGICFECRVTVNGRPHCRSCQTLCFQGSEVSIVSPDHPTERGEVGGPPVTLTDRFGDENQTTFQLREGALVSSGKSTDGSGETVFTPGADGRTLRVHRLMLSGRLSAPVDVTLTYRREGPP